MKESPAPQACRWRQSILLLTLALSTACVSKEVSDSGEDAKLQERISNAIQTAKQAKSSVIDMKLFTNSNSKRICFQSPYMSKNDFELQIGRQVDSFTPTLDDAYIWWLFDEKGSSVWARVMRVSIADKDQSPSPVCYDLRDWLMILQCDNSCKYSMRRK